MFAYVLSSAFRHHCGRRERGYQHDVLGLDVQSCNVQARRTTRKICKQCLEACLYTDHRSLAANAVSLADVSVSRCLECPRSRDLT